MEKSVLLNLLAAHPEVAAVALLILGFVAARLASFAVGHGLSALDRRVARITTTDTGILSPRLISLSRAFVFWLALMLAVALAARLLGVGNESAGLSDAFITFVPNALIAFAIVVAGHLIGLLASNILTQLNQGIAANSIGPRLLHGAIVAVAIVMALQHIGVDITFITRLLLILVAISSGGLMLAFALGARQHVANLLAHREVGRLVVGERIRAGDVEGTVVEISSTAVDVATKEGIASIPASYFADSSVLRMREESYND